jgi:hypothetical protein
LVEVGARDDKAHASSVIAADTPKDILAGELRRGRRISERTHGDKLNLAIWEILRICRSGGNAHTLEMAATAAR